MISSVAGHGALHKSQLGGDGVGGASQDTIPAAYISMIGVDQRFAGGGYGGDLLVDALKRIVRAADALGIAVVMLDVLDDGNEGSVAKRKTLYEGYGF